MDKSLSGCLNWVVMLGQPSKKVEEISTLGLVHLDEVVASDPIESVAVIVMLACEPSWLDKDICPCLSMGLWTLASGQPHNVLFRKSILKYSEIV